MNIVLRIICSCAWFAELGHHGRVMHHLLRHTPPTQVITSNKYTFKQNTQQAELHIFDYLICFYPMKLPGSLLFVMNFCKIRHDTAMVN